MHRGRLLALFAVSGAAALIYEVVWTRLLTLQMGHGLAAASTVLGAFMGGLAVGAGVAGRVGGRLSPRRALGVYAALELSIGTLALVLPLALAAIRPLLAAAYAEGHGGVTFALLRLGSSVLLVAVPAAAMGATFPIASRWMVRHASQAARDAGGLYAANTLGAAAGAVLAGFVLVPSLGLWGATWVGVAFNVTAAAGAWLIARGAVQASTEGRDFSPAQAAKEGRDFSPAQAAGAEAPALRKQQAPARQKQQAPARRKKHAPQAGAEAPALQALRTPHPWLAAAALGASGFASLALQVVWARLLAMVLGPTTYAFSLIVAIFILGLAAGAALGAWRAARTRQAATGLAVCLLASAGLSLGAATGVDWALMSMAEFTSRPNLLFADVLLRQALLVAALLLPMTLAFGAAFPFAVAVGSGRDDQVTETLGLIYAVNTLGAIAGALASGFVLVPRLGLHDTIRLVSAATALTAVAVLAFSGGRGRRIALAAAALVLAAAVALPQWDRLLLSSGAYKYAATFTGPSLDTALRAGELLSYREGATGTVMVRRLAGTLSLAIDGKVDASNAGDMLTQRLLAHLPLLLHPDPRRAAILGLGSGVTLGSALTHPLDEVVAIEISPEVVDASRFFEAENHGALHNPKTRLVVGDGRTHLLMGRQRYDVIISEPSNPWMAGIASLFTREFFEAARDRLTPDGVLCQWAHTYDISSEDLRSIVATFLSVFPHGTMWMVGDADVLLIGSAEPLDARMAGLAAAWQRPGVAADLSTVGARSPFALLSLFVAQGPALARWVGDARLQTDNHARLEFSGPRAIVGRSRDDNAAALRDLARQAPPPAAVAAARAGATGADWRDRGLMLLKADGPRPAYADFVRAIEADPDDGAALDGLVRAAEPSEQVTGARALLTRIASQPARHPAKLALSRLLASQGAFEEAMRIPMGLLRDDAGDLPALDQLASVLADVGDADRLAPVVAQLLLRDPASAGAHYYSATLSFLRERPDQALHAARRAVGLDAGHAKAHNLIGASLATMGRRDEARQAFLTSLSVDPRDPATYTNLATLELQAGHVDLARRYLAEALTLDPTSESARQGLASLGHPIH